MSQDLVMIYVLSSKKAEFHFTNSGTLPARKISRRFWVQIYEGKKYLHTKTSWTDEIPDERIKMSSLAPNEHYSVDVFWDVIRYDSALKTSDCYFGLDLEYYGEDDNEKYCYIMEGHFDHGLLMLDKVEIT
jgi:hypothetical protein